MAKPSYPLRLPEQLDFDARARCAALGISLNALIAVALDAYLAKPGGKRSAAGKPSAAAASKPSQKPFEPYHSDPDNWRNFHNVDKWPFCDPDWDSGLDEPDDFDPDSAAWTIYFAEIDRLYWQSHEKPIR